MLLHDDAFIDILWWAFNQMWRFIDNVLVYRIGLINSVIYFQSKLYLKFVMAIGITYFTG